MATGISVSSRCEHCPIRVLAEQHPQSILSRFWRRHWHNKWCPGWKMGRRSPARVN